MASRCSGAKVIFCRSSNHASARFDIDGDGGRRHAKESVQKGRRAALGSVEGLEIDRVES